MDNITSLADEEWRSVAGYPNTEVSNYGRVRSLFRGNVKVRSISVGTTGYYVVSLQNKSVRQPKKVHRLVADAFIGPSNGLDVNHKDGNKLNNCVDNLEYVTRSENLKHAFRMGLATTPFGKRGEASLQSILTDGKVIAMRKAFADGTSRRQLATDYGISYYTVWDITKRRSWTHI